MIAFQKTISDLTAKVEEKQIKIDELNEKLNSCAADNASLVIQIKQLEDQVASYIISNKAADVRIIHILFIVCLRSVILCQRLVSRIFRNTGRR